MMGREARLSRALPERARAAAAYLGHGGRPTSAGRWGCASVNDSPLPSWIVRMWRSQPRGTSCMQDASGVKGKGVIG